MSSFTEFQAIVLGKLSSIEERIADIEAILGISCISDSEEKAAENVDYEPEIVEKNSNYTELKEGISDFQKQLDDIKSLFSE